MTAKIYFGARTKTLLFFVCSILLKNGDIQAQCPGLGASTTVANAAVHRSE